MPLDSDAIHSPNAIANDVYSFLVRKYNSSIEYLPQHAPKVLSCVAPITYTTFGTATQTKLAESWNKPIIYDRVKK
eukprot:7217241-Pyramimonas_sp.AAC.3